MFGFAAAELGTVVHNHDDIFSIFHANSERLARRHTVYIAKKISQMEDEWFATWYSIAAVLILMLLISYRGVAL